MKKTMTLALLGILVLGLAVQAETLDQALNRITAASGNFKDFSGDMTMKMDMNMGPMSVNMNSTGKMLLLR